MIVRLTVWTSRTIQSGLAAMVLPIPGNLNVSTPHLVLKRGWVHNLETRRSTVTCEWPHFLGPFTVLLTAFRGARFVNLSVALLTDICLQTVELCILQTHEVLVGKYMTSNCTDHISAMGATRRAIAFSPLRTKAAMYLPNTYLS
jgi:hypothetical protein